MLSPRQLAPAAVCGALLTAAAPASAAELYVSQEGIDTNNTTCAESSPCRTVGKAAQIAPQGSTIHIGPGSYEEAVSVLKTFHFVGAGPGDPEDFDASTDTRIHAPEGLAALKMTFGGSVTALRLEGGAGGNSGSGGVALELSAPSAAVTRSYTVSGLVAIGGAEGDDGNSDTFDDPGRGLSVASPGPSVVNVTAADSLFRSDDYAAQLAGGGTGAFSGVTFSSPTRGLSISSASEVTVDRSVVTGNPGSGIVPFDDTAVRISRSTIIANGGPLSNNPGDGPSYDVRDSVLASVGGRDLQLAGPATLTARGTTIYSRGALDSPALLLVGDAAGPAVANVTNTIIRDVDTGGSPDPDVLVHGEGEPGTTFTAKHSAFSEVETADGGTATAPISGSIVSGDPGFVDEAAQDFRLLPSSPLIDRGDPAVFTPGDLDLAGNPRSLDGNGDCVAAPDIGAFERADVCPAGPPETIGAGGTDLTAPGFERLRLARRVFRVGTPVAPARAKKGTRFLMTLSEAATVQVRIERRRGRRARRRWARRGLLTRAMPAGRGQMAFSGRIGRRKLKPGRYRARIHATDAAGNRSATRTLRFRIVRR